MLGERKTLFVEVILPLPIENYFTYRVPTELNDEVLTGKRVAVYFGGQKVYAALIRHIRTKPPEGYKANYIIQVLDDSPILSEREFIFWEWVAKYYMSPIGEVMNLAFPAGLKLKNESIILPAFEELPNDLELEDKERILLNTLIKQGQIKLADIAELLAVHSGLKYIKALHDRGLIQIQEKVKERYKSKIVRHIQLVPEFSNEHFAREILDNLEKKAPKQVNVLLTLLSNPNGPIPKSEFTKKHNLSSSSINTLVKNGLILETLEKVKRIQPNASPSLDFDLTKVQLKAVDEIVSGFKQNKPTLLHGNTHTGKSYIFSYLARQIIDNGKQVLYLLPEVALTEEFHRRLESYFGDELVSIHTKYNQNEKVEIWDEIRSGRAKIVVGPRSAVFLPFHDLGLILVDEEHENSYKQNEKAPRFNGRSVALYLSKSWECPILLASATPSIETYYLAKNGTYHLVEIEESYLDKPMPEFLVIDTKKEKKAGRMHSFISDKLYEEISSNFEAKNQAIFFQNRKGYVPITECNTCGWTQKCINCDISLTYYKYSHNLRCHYCGYHEYSVSTCPDCGSTEIQTQGAGTELITEELQSLFPERTIERFDQESTRGKNKVHQLLSGIQSGSIDALVGTQILAKGMRFNNVQLASIIQADQLLNFPDFRAFERAFQLIVQLSGRVGNSENKGKVVIQIGKPDHPIMEFVLTRDYKGFYQKEIVEREQFFYPPFSRIVLIQLKHKLPGTVERAAQQMAQYLKTELGNKVLGPESPHIARIRNRYIQQILIKMDRDQDNIAQIKAQIRHIGNHMRKMKDFKSVQITYNVDPQ